MKKAVICPRVKNAHGTKDSFRDTTHIGRGNPTISINAVTGRDVRFYWRQKCRVLPRLRSVFRARIHRRPLTSDGSLGMRADATRSIKAIFHSIV